VPTPPSLHRPHSAHSSVPASSAASLASPTAQLTSHALRVIWVRWEQGELDPFCKYLYGVVLIDREGKSAVHHTQDTVAPSVLAVRARTVLCECLREFPWHWGAWQALMGLCLDSASADSLDVPHDW
jgi:hypothetical protein